MLTEKDFYFILLCVVPMAAILLAALWDKAEKKIKERRRIKKW